MSYLISVLVMLRTSIVYQGSGYLVSLLVMLRISIGYSGGLSDQSSCYVKDFYWISGEWVSGQSS